jgi:DNA repair photolyase
MKINLILFVAFSFLVSPVMADKPDSAAKVKPTAAQKAAMDAGEAYDEASEEPSDEAAVKVKEKKKQKKKKKDKSAKSEKSEKSEKSAKSKKSAKGEMGDEDEQNEENDASSELTGLDKQRVKKAEQLQNEIDKGSDKGIAARTENSKKWWKFWGE